MLERFANDPFPPCIRLLYEKVKSGDQISYIERFTLISFLHNIGIKTEETIGLFSSSSGFNEKQSAIKLNIQRSITRHPVAR